MKQRATTLAICVLGLYGSFLSWSLLQERINTKPYGVDKFGNPEFFKAPLVVNLVQALFASIVGVIYSASTRKGNPFKLFTQNDKSTSLRYFKSLLIISVCSSLSSPLGYQSLKHVDYLAYLLAKSCKLIPVMLIHLLFYRTRFPPYKYTVAMLVTGGVVLFTVAHKKSTSKDSINDEQTILGMSQLIGSMLLDGITNSTQDQLFKSQYNNKVKMTGALLMCILNLFVFALTFGYALLFDRNEVEYTLGFINRHPGVVLNTLAFASFGAIGQVFVFIILEKFDSLILVTATVTRKMISMILSVVLFGHYLNAYQWVGVIFVFGGISYEAFIKMFSKAEEKKKAKGENEEKKKI